jgi:cytochrome P450
MAALEAGLRAMFSMPDSAQRARLGAMIRGYVEGPGHPNILDMLARDESAFWFATRKRRAFQKAWFSAVDEVVALRSRSRQDGEHRDLLDLLLVARNVETSEALSATEVRDQCATFIFGGFETTARLLFRASYLLTLDLAEQERLRTEVAAFSPERLSSLEDLANWPRLRMTLLETLRLYPPVPHLVREPVVDDKIVGEPVKARSQIWISPWVTHRHRKFWEQPTAFIPERFAGKTASHSSAKPSRNTGSPSNDLAAVDRVVSRSAFLSPLRAAIARSREGVGKGPRAPRLRLSVLLATARPHQSRAIAGGDMFRSGATTVFSDIRRGQTSACRGGQA